MACFRIKKKKINENMWGINEMNMGNNGAGYRMEC